MFYYHYKRAQQVKGLTQYSSTNSPHPFIRRFMINQDKVITILVIR